MTGYRSFAETLGLNTSALPLVRELIHQRLGLYYDDGKTDLLAEKLSPLVLERGFDSFLTYYYLLKYDPSADDEWRKVMDALSVQETYFWREFDQIRALVEKIVPQWVADHPGQTLRIWSAACATGEEPLTIAIALQEKGWFLRAPIEIIGTDASAAAIQKAKQGIYRERAFRVMPLELRAKYFTETANGWRVDPALQAKVRWGIANLMAEDEIAGLATAPVIFCRNVFIYFSQEAIQTTVRRFAEWMPVPGYLFVGAAESLLRHTRDFELQQIAGALVYVKH